MVKYIIGLLFLLTGNSLLAQEPTLVTYDQFRIYTCTKQKKNKKSATKKIIAQLATVIQREAKLIYSPTYLIFRSHEGVDTVFLSSVTETRRPAFGHNIWISYNNDLDFILLDFSNDLEAKRCRKFMRENGWHFKRKTGVKILSSILEGVLILPLLVW